MVSWMKEGYNTLIAVWEKFLLLKNQDGQEPEGELSFTIIKVMFKNDWLYVKKPTVGWIERLFNQLMLLPHICVSL